MMSATFTELNQKKMSDLEHILSTLKVTVKQKRNTCGRCDNYPWQLSVIKFIKCQVYFKKSPSSTTFVYLFYLSIYLFILLIHENI